ncbi:MAG: hypothetical protein PHN60_02355 [Candidatus Gracilibacteria bacterium]|nr:hypothetical protein [Candidatus Gracilibacteria bacterium]
MKNQLFDKAGELVGKILRKRKKGSATVDSQSDFTRGRIGGKISDVLDFAGKSGHETEVLRGLISEQQSTIEEQQRIISGQRHIIKRDSRASGLVLAVSCVTGGVVGGTGTAFYGQVSPESSVQEYTSSLAKVFSDEETGYDIIQKGKENILIVKTQAKELNKCSVINGTLQEAVVKGEEIMGTYRVIIGLDESRINNLSAELLEEQKKSENCNLRRKKQFVGSREEEKQSKNFVGADNSKIYATLSKLRSEIMAGFPDKNIEMKIQEQSGGGILVWMEYKGMGSLGFYADSIKNQNRLTKEGMSSWIQFSIDQLLLVEQIQSVALSKNIGLSKNSFVSMEIKKLYTGNVTVMLSDSLSKKTGKFTVTIKKDTQEDISREIDKILEGFLSNTAKAPLSDETSKNISPSEGNTETHLS